MKRTRTPSVSSASRLALDVAAEQASSGPATSVWVRFQFSVEKAKIVRYLDAEIGAGLDDLAHPPGAGVVAEQPRPAALLSPSGRCRP